MSLEAEELNRGIIEYRLVETLKVSLGREDLTCDLKTSGML
jgi:hypothetical protein